MNSECWKSHRSDRLENCTFDGYHAYSRRLGKVRGFDLVGSASMGLVCLVTHITRKINPRNTLADRNVNSTDTDLRYMAYATRLRTALRAGTRYIAYTSDVGEAFRPVVPPAVVTACYGISWIYLAGDVSYEAYKTHRRGPNQIEAAHFSEPTRVGMVAVKRAVFQSIASMFVHVRFHTTLFHHFPA